ncbi:MAG: hypothetical protein CMK32_10205 [Porticoccaceae bacterium]|nr:hypothetical protein [Porticoccaceae bacterium]
MPSLSELKNKYGLGESAKYEPYQKCKHCQGNGERWIKKLQRWHFCICLFVNHEASDEIGDMMRQFAKKKLKEIDENGST